MQTTVETGEEGGGEVEGRERKEGEWKRREEGGSGMEEWGRKRCDRETRVDGGRSISGGGHRWERGRRWSG